MEIKQPSHQSDLLLQQTRMQQMQLSAMADMKANMLMTMASVVITLSAPQIIKPDLTWAAIVLIVFCLLTILLASFTAMPRVPLLIKSGEPPDVDSPTFNLLFFADFSCFSYPEFEAAMEQVMNDPNRTYKTQVKEIYNVGIMLSTKKYRFVRLAYISFITGLFTSGLVMLATNTMTV